MKNERDTHFAGFAELLYDEMEALSQVRPMLPRREMEQLLAQRAYDLVEHILKQTPSGTLYIRLFQDMTAWPERERFANTLADLAKIESKIRQLPTNDTSEQSP